MFSSWLMKEGIGLLLGALAKLLFSMWQSNQNDKAQRDLGAARATNEANVKTIEMQDAIESIPRPADDVVADRLRNGTF